MAKKKSGDLLSMGKRVVICMSPAFYKEIEDRAKAEQTTVSALLRKAAVEYMKSPA